MNWLTLILALMAVESGGNDLAVGDKGKAHGPLQIHSEVIQDVNKHYGTAYKWPADCYSREKSFDICRKYLEIYKGKGDGYQQLARKWNGGPKGHRNPRTAKYWRKVSKEIK